VESLCTRPERRGEAIAALKDRDGEPVLGYGLGRSYGDAALVTGGRLVLTTRLDCMLDFDPVTGWLRCEAGVSVEEIINTFLPRGFFPPVVPGTQFVTVGGALASDIHGKNHHVDGAWSDHVRNVELLLGTGEIVVCDAEQNAELFWATAGGQGLTGLILAMDLRLVPVLSPNIEMESIRVNNLDEFFAVSADSADFSHTVSWLDTTRRGDAMGRGIFMRGRHAGQGSEAGANPLGALADLLEPVADIGFLDSDLLLNRVTMGLFNEAFFRKTPAGVSKATVGYKPFFFPLDVARNWNYVYGPRGFLQYQFVVPKDRDHHAVRAILDLFVSRGFVSFLSVIKEFAERQHPWLSFPRPGVTVAMDIPFGGQALLDTMDEADAIVAEVGGRIYLGKDARLSRAMFRRMYPDWEAWKAVRDAADPEGVFQSDLGRRLGLCGG